MQSLESKLTQQRFLKKYPKRMTVPRKPMAQVIALPPQDKPQNRDTAI